MRSQVAAGNGKDGVATEVLGFLRNDSTGALRSPEELRNLPELQQRIATDLEFRGVFERTIDLAGGDYEKLAQIGQRTSTPLELKLRNPSLNAQELNRMSLLADRYRDSQARFREFKRRAGEVEVELRRTGEILARPLESPSESVLLRSVSDGKIDICKGSSRCRGAHC